MLADSQRPFRGCTHHKTATADIIQWSNWEIRKGRTQWLSLLGMLLGLVVLVLVAYGSLYYGGGSLWAVAQGAALSADVVLRAAIMIGGLLILAGLAAAILFSFAQLMRQQTVIISAQQLMLYDMGLWRTYKRSYPKEGVIGLAFTKPAVENNKAAEPQLLLICTSAGGKRPRWWSRSLKTHIPLASWMHSQDQRQLFLLLQSCFTAYKWRLQIKEEGGEGQSKK